MNDQICMYLSSVVACSLTAGTVAYFDTAGSFVPNRLIQMCADRARLSGTSVDEACVFFPIRMQFASA